MNFLVLPCFPREVLMSCSHYLFIWKGTVHFDQLWRSRARGGLPLLWNYGYLSMRENLVMTSLYVRKKEHSVLNNRLPNNTQITTNNISGLLCRSRPLHFIEDQRSLKNRFVKNTSQNASRKINGVLDTYLQETLVGQEKPLQKTRERREKIEETWVGTKPKKLVETKRRSNSNRVKCYFWNQSTDLNKS